MSQAGTGNVEAVLPISAFLFLAFMYREVLMDLGDTKGDRAARVWTLPVMLGRKVALYIGLTMLTAGATLAAAAARHGSGLAWLVSSDSAHICQTCTQQFVVSVSIAHFISFSGALQVGDAV